MDSSKVSAESGAATQGDVVDLVRAEEAPKSTSLVAPPTKKPWIKPSVITSETLKELIGVGEGANASWACPFCSSTGKGTTRCVDHLVENHPKVSGVLEICKCFVEKNGRDPHRTQMLARINALGTVSTFSGVEDSRKTPLQKMLSFDATSCIKHAYALSILQGALPMNMCEREWPKHILDAGIKIGARAVYDRWREEMRKAPPPFHEMIIPQANSYKISRVSVTSTVDEEAESATMNMRVLALKQAKISGATQLSDGRSNIKNDALLVFGVQAGDMFLPQGAHNAGANKKDADYLAARSVDYLEQDPELADETFAAVGDGAASAQAALRKTADWEYLIPIRCQSHAVSLLLKDVALKGFGSTLDEAEKIIGWVRGHPRISSLLKKVTGNRVLYRFIPIRFATHVTGCKRLLDLKTALRASLLDDHYLDYKSTLTEKGRIEATEMELVINRQEFWSEVDLFVKISIPIVVALRVMDRSLTRTKHILDLWSELGSKFMLAMHQVNLNSERRTSLMGIFEKRRKDSLQPIFEASWVLDPRNIAVIREGLRDPTSTGSVELSRRVEHAREILALIVKRKALIKLRQAKRGKDDYQQAKKMRIDLEVQVATDNTSVNKEIKPEEIDAGFNVLWSEVNREFRDYISQTGTFKNVEMAVEDDWLHHTGLLKYFAIRLLNMSASISDVERLHKVYSQVHTCTRNSLKDDRVDRLTQGRIALKILELQNTNRKEQFSLEPLETYKKDKLDSEQFMAQLDCWTQEISSTAVAISRAISTQALLPGFDVEGKAEDDLEREDAARSVEGSEEIVDVGIEVDDDTDENEGLESDC